jgi:DNA repair protein RecO (recombination protein O)
LVALSGPGEVASALVRFELTALRETGHMPTLSDCAACGRAVEPVGRVPFSQRAGGVLCKSCRSGQKQIISVSGGVIKALAQLAGNLRPDGSQVELEARTYGEMRGVLNHYWTHLMGRPARMQRWLPTSTDGTSQTD